MTMQREILVRLRTSALMAMLGLGTAAAAASAQSTLGVPFIGDNHLSFYSTELTSDGIGASMSTLYGGRYAHRFGSDDARSRFSLSLQGAGRTLADASSGILDVSMTVAWTRRMDEIDEDLSMTGAMGMSALVWGMDETDTGIAHGSLPMTAAVAYDLHIGSATLTPFVAPGIAYYDHRGYLHSVRVSREVGWDARFTTGTSLTLKEVVLTASRIHGESNLPNRSRWAFAAGISF